MLVRHVPAFNVLHWAFLGRTPGVPAFESDRLLALLIHSGRGGGLDTICMVGADPDRVGWASKGVPATMNCIKHKRSQAILIRYFRELEKHASLSDKRGANGRSGRTHEPREHHGVMVAVD